MLTIYAVRCPFEFLKACSRLIQLVLMLSIYVVWRVLLLRCFCTHNIQTVLLNTALFTTICVCSIRERRENGPLPMYPPYWQSSGAGEMACALRSCTRTIVETNSRTLKVCTCRARLYAQALLRWQQLDLARSWRLFLFLTTLWITMLAS